jgi:hypothetical protein
MLIVWLTILPPEDQQQITYIDPRAKYWPRNWAEGLGYNEAIPIDWWISFSQGKYGLIWIMRYPQWSRIVYQD